MSVLPKPVLHAPAPDDELQSDARATNSATWRTLYKAREPIYPKSVKGSFRRIKWIVMGVLLAIYYVVPFIRWDRGPGQPDQAVLVDLDRPRFYFMWLELWPQEIYYIAGLLILAGISLFLFTALFGRVWCGYACPQTVWTDLFLAVEGFFEGDRSARIRLAKEPWTAKKIARKTGKHIAWLFIAFATGGAWVLYFYDAPSFYPAFFSGTAPMMAYVFVAGLTFTTYTLAGFMREQVCTYMCPWPRIQAAMIDSETLSVAYRKERGEPRAPHKKGADWTGRGDCIDCNQCVAACPMGIDIRDGDQLECINCGLCIDACDTIMDKVGRPHGLIAYESAANQERLHQGQPAHLRFVRSRTVFYAVIATLVGLALLAALIVRSPTDLNVLRDRNPMYVRLADGGIRNAYTVKIANRSTEPKIFALSVRGLDEAELREGGGDAAPGKSVDVTVNPDEIRSIRLLASVDAPAGETRTIAIVATDKASGETTTCSTTFVTESGS